MTHDLAIAWLIFNVILVTITLVWGIFRFRRGIWYRKLTLKIQAYLLWGIGGIALLSSFIPFAYLFTENLWYFEEAGYTNVFLTIIKLRWGLFFGFFFVALVFMNLNAFIAKKLCPEPREFSRWTHDRTVSFHRTFFCGTVLLAILFAIPMMSLHDEFILYTGQPKEEKVILADAEITDTEKLDTEITDAEIVDTENSDIEKLDTEITDAEIVDTENTDTETTDVDINQTSITKTLFYGKDTNFYLFSFPMHQAVSRWVQFLLWATCGIVCLLYNFYYRRDARSMGFVKRNIVYHGSVLWLMLLAIAIWRGYVNLWSKVYTPPLSSRLSEFHGLFYADSMLAGATQLYCIILLIIGVVVLFNIFWRKRILWYASIGISIISYICLIHIYPIGVNIWVVRSAGQAYPVEEPFLEQHIIDTRIAFDLETIEEEQYEKKPVTIETMSLTENVGRNIQFWDRRVFYNILRNEEIKRHHDFHPYADVDRYRLTPKRTSDTILLEAQGDESSDNSLQANQNTSDNTLEMIEQYRQVLIAAREIDPDPGPKEWGELKLKFTHGYGVCVAPVNAVDGFKPSLWVKGVPITQSVTGYEYFRTLDDDGALITKGVPISEAAGLNYSEELDVRQPRIYYGEMTDDYVIVNTKTPEYNIEEEEKKDNNGTPETEKIGYHYQGTGGVRLGGWFRRLCFAVRFNSIFILRNSQLMQDSRVMYWRRIGTRHNNRLVIDRLSHIAPFLDFDPDPYIVIDDGQLWWIVDFYVTSNRYPNAQLYKDDTSPIEYNDLELYTEPRFKRFKKFNYIRNSGVAVVNAYNGNVNFYTDIVDEPITEIYRKTFPKLFKYIDEMPEGLKAHRRFPDYLTRIQAKMYGNYHVTDTETFFDKKEQWKIPKEAYYSETPNQEMMPYYAMLKLPGEETAEFVNMIPFTPPQKDNFMKGWLIARCDKPNYGQRIVYTLPDDINVIGPKHVEDEISKDTDLSELFFSLRDKNKIIRGNLHVIPHEKGIYYVEPIFVIPKVPEDEETDSSDPIKYLPSLKTIVVKTADHKTLAADISFSQALLDVFLREDPPTTLTENENGVKEPTLADLYEDVQKAMEAFGKALKAEENGKKQAAPKNAGKKK